MPASARASGVGIGSVALFLVLGSTCEQDTPPVPTAAFFLAGEQILVLAKRDETSPADGSVADAGGVGDAGQPLAAPLERSAWAKLFEESGKSRFEISLEGPGLQQLSTMVPRADGSFWLAGEDGDALWTVSLDTGGSVRAQRAYAAAGYVIRVADGSTVGEDTVLAGTAAAASATHALWLSLRPNGFVRWALRSSGEAELARIVSPANGASVLVGTVGTAPSRRPFIATLAAGGSLQEVFSLETGGDSLARDGVFIDANALLVAGALGPLASAPGVFVVAVEHRTGRVRWSKQFSVARGVVGLVRVATGNNRILVAAELSGLGTPPGSEADVLYLWLDGDGNQQQAFVFGSAAAHAPLRIGSIDGATGGRPSAGAAVLVRVGDRVERKTVSAETADGCGTRTSVTVLPRTIAPAADTLHLAPVSVPLIQAFPRALAARRTTAPPPICR